MVKSCVSKLLTDGLDLHTGQYSSFLSFSLFYSLSYLPRCSPGFIPVCLNILSLSCVLCSLLVVGKHPVDQTMQREIITKTKVMTVEWTFIYYYTNGFMKHFKNSIKTWRNWTCRDPVNPGGCWQKLDQWIQFTGCRHKISNTHRKTNQNIMCLYRCSWNYFFTNRGVSIRLCCKVVPAGNSQ